MRHIITIILAFVLAVSWSGCKKDIPASSLPWTIRDFIRIYYPGKNITRVQFRDYAPAPYSGSSVQVSVPLNGGGITVIDNSNNFNYSFWGYSNNRSFYGLYTVTLDDTIVLEFTGDGFFIRRIR